MQDYLLGLGYLVNHKQIRWLMSKARIHDRYSKRNLSNVGMAKYIHPYLLRDLMVECLEVGLVDRYHIYPDEQWHHVLDSHYRRLQPLYSGMGIAQHPPGEKREGSPAPVHRAVWDTENSQFRSEEPVLFPCGWKSWMRTGYAPAWMVKAQAVVKFTKQQQFPLGWKAGSRETDLDTFAFNEV